MKQAHGRRLVANRSRSLARLLTAVSFLRQNAGAPSIGNLVDDEVEKSFSVGLVLLAETMVAIYTVPEITPGDEHSGETPSEMRVRQKSYAKVFV
jgi:hypothetical protein